MQQEAINTINLKKKKKHIKIDIDIFNGQLITIKNNNEKKVKYVKNSISYITNNLHFPERNFPKLQYTNVYMYKIKINN
jgi:hypothetical protein